MRTVWRDNTPDSLLDTVASFCVLNIHLVSKQVSPEHHKDIHLPTELGEKLFQV